MKIANFGRPTSALTERRPSVGIGVTTYNRAAMLRRTIEAVERYTQAPHILFVVDDGSSDDTVSVLRATGVTYLTAANRGIAWNKNRALFFLGAVCGCDIIILLEDDTFPISEGWEAVWIDAAMRYGHVNLAPSHWPKDYLSGSGTPADPYVSQILTGQCAAFTRQAIDFVGYMDTRFRRYGFEHVEHTNRMIDCGYGGLHDTKDRRHLPYLITSDLTVSGLDKPPDMDGIHHNGPIFEQLRSEPRHRSAWRGDEEMALFRCEQASVVSRTQSRVSRPDFGPDWIVLSCDGLPLLTSRDSTSLYGGIPNPGDSYIIVRVRAKTARLGIMDDDQVSWLTVDKDLSFKECSSEGEAALFDFITASGPGFGLRHGGHFLCCDISRMHSVSLNRPRLSQWETFLFGGYVFTQRESTTKLLAPSPTISLHGQA